MREVEEKKKRSKASSTEEIRNSIENHFSALLINLSEMDNQLSEYDVRDLLGEEMKTVSAYLNDEVEQLLKMKYGLRK